MSGPKKRYKSHSEDDDYCGSDRDKKPLASFSKVTSRPKATSRRTEGDFKRPPMATAAAAPAPAKVSAQMQAVVRLMSGQEERTIAQKLSDSNRPTWDDYKKANEDKLNLDGMDRKKMEEYRKELDAEREKILSRGINHGASKMKKKRKKRDSDNGSSASCSSGEDSRKRSKKHKKGRKRKQKHRRSEYDKGSEDSRKKKKKHRKKKKKDNGSDSDDGNHYRLSNFFTAASDDD